MIKVVYFGTPVLVKNPELTPWLTFNELGDVRAVSGIDTLYPEGGYWCCRDDWDYLEVEDCDRADNGDDAYVPDEYHKKFAESITHIDDLPRWEG